MNGRTDEERIADMLQYAREAIATLANADFAEFSLTENSSCRFFIWSWWSVRPPANASRTRCNSTRESSGIESEARATALCMATTTWI